MVGRMLGRCDDISYSSRETTQHIYTLTHTHMLTYEHTHLHTYTYAQDLKRLDCPFRSNQATGSNPL